jgi:hypothetical protein
MVSRYWTLYPCRREGYQTMKGFGVGLTKWKRSDLELELEGIFVESY